MRPFGPAPSAGGSVQFTQRTHSEALNMGAGPAIAIAVGLSIIYGGMVLAIIVGLRFAARDEEQH